MSRLAPLIVRSSHPVLVRRSAPAAAAAFAFESAASPTSDDLRWFMTSFLGGLAFFGTYLA